MAHLTGASPGGAAAGPWPAVSEVTAKGEQWGQGVLLPLPESERTSLLP